MAALIGGEMARIASLIETQPTEDGSLHVLLLLLMPVALSCTTRTVPAT